MLGMTEFSLFGMTIFFKDKRSLAITNRQSIKRFKTIPNNH